MKIAKDKYVLVTTLVLYMLLFIMTIVFFKERLSIDSSYYFFKSINTQSFHLEHQRFVLLIAELPIVLGANLNIPLQTVVLSYSIWHVLFYFLFGFYLYRRYKKASYLLLFLSLQTIGIYYSFINPIFELYYGIAFLAALYILLRENDKLNFQHYVLIGLYTLFIITSHPFNIVLYLGILLIDSLRRKNIYLLVTTAVSIMLILYVKSFYVSEYEQGKISWILNFQENRAYLNLFNGAYLKNHFNFLFEYYADFLGLLVITLTLGYKYIPRKKYLLILLGIIGASVMAHLSFNLDASGGYAEQVFFIVVALVVMTFFMELLPYIKKQHVVHLLLVIIFILIGSRLYQQSRLGADYGKRIQWISAQSEKMNRSGICKGLFPMNNQNEIYSYLGWDIPYTSMIYSSMTNPNSTVSIAPMHIADTSFFYNIKSLDYYFRLDEIEPIQQLNKKYFKLCDQKKYQLIKK